MTAYYLSVCEVEKQKSKEMKAQADRFFVRNLPSCFGEARAPNGCFQCLGFTAALILFSPGIVNTFDNSKNAFVELYSINFFQLFKF